MLPYLAEDLIAAVRDPAVWNAIGFALVAFLAVWVLGASFSRHVGLLRAGAPHGEVLSVGLSLGLVTVAGVWSTVATVGQTSFAPIAIGLTIALLLGFRKPKWRSHLAWGAPRLPVIASSIAACGLVALLGLANGSTQAPSTRSGVQPMEFTDTGYYAALAINLGETGRETTTNPSGFDDVPGYPRQSWYHWGEIWLTTAVIRTTSIDPITARNYVVLPIVLLAGAGLTGTLLRRLLRTTSRRAFVFGALGFLFLAPLAVPSDSFFGGWAVGNMYGVGLYGLSTVTVLLSLYAIVASEDEQSPSLTVLAGTLVGSILATHIVVALVAAMASVVAISADHGLTWARSRTATIRPTYARIALVASAVGLATAVWGTVTDHAITLSSSSTLVTSFDSGWRSGVTRAIGFSGIMLLLPAAWFVETRRGNRRLAILFGTGTVAVGLGAALWGARFADYNTFHAFFGAIAVVATPLALIAIWSTWQHLNASGNRLLGLGVLALAVVQIETGIPPTIIRMMGVKPSQYDPVPVAILDKIRGLPAGAKLAYACAVDEEFHFGDPRLVPIYAHTGRRVIPLCYQEDFLSSLQGAPDHTGVENPTFALAPQRMLFAGRDLRPSSQAVMGFMRSHGIEFIYADTRHPNVLVPDATLLAADGPVRLYEIP